MEPLGKHQNQSVCWCIPGGGDFRVAFRISAPRFTVQVACTDSQSSMYVRDGSICKNSVRRRRVAGCSCSAVTVPERLPGRLFNPKSSQHFLTPLIMA